MHDSNRALEHRMSQTALDGAVSWPLPSPEDTNRYSDGTLTFRCQKAQQPKKQPLRARCKART